MNIYLIYFMIAVIFFIIIHSYYLPKNKYCHLNRSNNETQLNSNTKNNNNDKNNNQVREGFDGHTEQDRRYIKVSDLKELEEKTYEQIASIDDKTKQINDFKENDNKKFYRANSNLDSYKKVKKFIEDEKYNARYHESLREYDRDVKIDTLNTEFNKLSSQIPDFLDEPGKIKNIKNQNANHYIKVSQKSEFDDKSKNINRNNPLTVFVNNGCLSFNNEDNSFKVSDMCNLTDGKQQFKFNKIDNKNTYNKIVKDSGNEFLYSIPNIKNYKLVIEASGNTFKWNNNGSGIYPNTGVSITGNAQSLEGNVSVNFASTSGHSKDDYFTFTVQNNVISKQSSNIIDGTMTPTISDIMTPTTSNESAISDNERDNGKINDLDQPFYIINPVENIEDNKKCLTQLGEHLSVEPCNLHTNQRWIPDFQDRK